MLLEGLHLPLTTPFYSDGRLNLRKMEHNVARYSKTPAAGLVVLSHAGEATMLSDDETRQTLRSAVDAAATEKVLIAGVSRDSVMVTLDLADYAADLGFDAVLVKRPSLLEVRHSTRELLTYFQVVADRSALPVVLYSTTDEQTGWLAPDAVIELAAHPRIIGLVDGAGSRERIEFLAARTSAVA